MTNLLTVHPVYFHLANMNRQTSIDITFEFDKSADCSWSTGDAPRLAFFQRLYEFACRTLRFTICLNGDIMKMFFCLKYNIINLLYINETQDCHLTQRINSRWQVDTKALPPIMSLVNLSILLRYKNCKFIF